VSAVRLPTVGLSAVGLSPIANAMAFARATRTQVIAVCHVGRYCGGAYTNCVSIAWISGRKVTDGHVMAVIITATIAVMTLIVALILVVVPSVTDA